MLSLTSILNPPSSGHHAHYHTTPTSSSSATASSQPRSFAQAAPPLRSIPPIPSPPTSSSCSPTTPTSYPQMALGRSAFGPLIASQHHQHHHPGPSSPPRSVAMQEARQQQYNKTRPRGTVRFPPYEDLSDEAVLREMRRFRVQPLGAIKTSCAHIPYNSGKKNFFVKTGRESFEVFKYEFQIPGDNLSQPTVVMWDYNIGLVRMTPFFKCCNHAKTVPAKMLGQNPGLKEITHSITGGSISAQGYWMPYSCARAICATFCHKIAGALIPIFGPSFPRDCVDSESPLFNRMVVDPAVISQAIREADAFRRVYQHANMLAAAANASIALPPSPTAGWSAYQTYRQHGLDGRRKHFLPGGPGRMDPERERYGDRGYPENVSGPPLPSTPWPANDPRSRGQHYRFDPDIAPLPPASFPQHFSYPPPHHHGARGYPQYPGRLLPPPQPQPYRHHPDEPTDPFVPNPILSAVPQMLETDVPRSRWTSVNGAKRPLPPDTLVHNDAAASSTGSSSPTNSTEGIGALLTGRVIDQRHMAELDRTADVAVRKAAWLLVNLSVRDQREREAKPWENRKELDGYGAEGLQAGLDRVGDEEDGVHRAKRRRTASM